MSPLNQPQPESTRSEELVAYLDGELAPDECRAVEDRLANDAEYRQQLRDLDQAWEALDALPTTKLDDAFARTTIELACVAAQEDASQRKSAVAAESRGRRQWWIAGGIAAAVMGFLMVRALAVHRTNLQLADLPVIQQADVLAQVDSIEFLRQLQKTVKNDEFVRDKAAFSKAVTDFQQASSSSFTERRQWVDSLTPEQKSNLADSARAFTDLTTRPEEKDRQRQLAKELEQAPELQETLIAYGQWLNRSTHTAGWREDLRDELRKLPTATDKVAGIQQRLREEVYRYQHLSPDDQITFRREIVKLAEEKSRELPQLPLTDRMRRSTDGRDLSQTRLALRKLVTAIRNGAKIDELIGRLVQTLSPEAQDHWKALKNERERKVQFAQWLRDVAATGKDEELEAFFASDEVSPDDRQRLLERSREQMKRDLEEMYLHSEFGIDLSEFGDRGRVPGFGPEMRRSAPPPDGGGPPFGDGPGGRRGPGPGRGPGGPFRPRPNERFEEFGPPGPPPRPGDQPQSPPQGPPPKPIEAA